jgi:hypothetical protein
MRVYPLSECIVFAGVHPPFELRAVLALESIGIDSAPESLGSRESGRMRGADPIEDTSDRQKMIETNLRDEILRLPARAKPGFCGSPC